jgi:phospholipase/carboxylesterase
MQNKLHYIKREPLISIKNPPVLFMLHGYGSNEEDLFSFAPHLPKELLIISVQAPIPMGFGSYSWFDINQDAKIGLRSNLEQAKQSLILIEDLVNDILTNHQVNKDKIFMLGFSQGSFLSLSFAFKNPDIINKYICLSGYTRPEIIAEFAVKDAYPELDFFVSHGTQDQIIPIEIAREIPKILEQYKAKYVYKEYPIGHGVSPENFRDFNLWIQQRL